MDMTQPVAQGWLLGLVASQQRATTSSLLLIAQQLPWALSSVAGGALQDQAGFLPGFLLTAALYLASSALWLLLFRGESPVDEREPVGVGTMRDH
jgi:predicted MFS family arabinose efflux permease